MALALIREISREPAGVRVRFDLGHNRFVRWRVGERRSRTGHGLPQVAEVRQQSGLIGPLPPSARGRGEFLIPARQLSRQAPYLQLLSYRDEQGRGPAISAIERLPLEAVDSERPPVRIDDLPPPPAGMVAGGRNQREARVMTKEFSSHSTHVDNIPFQLAERRYSEPFFIESLLSALPTLVPMLAPAVGSLVAGMAPAVGQVAGQLIRSVTGSGAGNGANPAAQVANLADQTLRAAGPAAQQVLTPDNMRQIIALIEAARAPAPAAPTTASAQALALTGRRPLVGSTLKRRLAAKRGGRVSAGRSGTAEYDTARGVGTPVYSEAQVAPALLAALPALMPLLRQVLSPQTVQSIVQAPERMTGQVINGLKDFARLGIEADKAQMEHLRQLNPGVDDPALERLLASMSMELSAGRDNYRRVAAVQLSLDGVATQVIFGRERALYRQGAELRFPLSVTTPQPIRDAQLLLRIKHAETLRTVHEQREEVGMVSSGPLPSVVSVAASVSSQLAPLNDYIVELTLLWKNKRGQRRGSSIQHNITMMSRYRFDRVEESGELIALTDQQQFRDYWHQIWEGDFDRTMRRVELSTRYYLTLSPQRSRNARLDSKVRRRGDGPKVRIDLKSGYEYSLFSLNHLLRRLNPEAEPLGEEMLDALATDDFIERFAQAAQHQGSFRGRPGERAMLWVYPEFKLQTLVLVAAEQVNENGNVTQLAEHNVQFPMPAMLHFVGVVQS